MVIEANCPQAFFLYRLHQQKVIKTDDKKIINPWLMTFFNSIDY